MRHYARLTLLSSLLLTGCTSLAMEGLNGTGACPVDAVAVTTGNVSGLNGLTPGATVNDLSGLTGPEKRQKIRLMDGRSVEVWSYRTSYSLCRNMPTEEQFTPVIVDANTGLILGVGTRAAAAIGLRPTSAGPSISSLLP